MVVGVVVVDDKAKVVVVEACVECWRRECDANRGEADDCWIPAKASVGTSHADVMDNQKHEFLHHTVVILSLPLVLWLCI